MMKSRASAGLLFSLIHRFPQKRQVFSHFFTQNPSFPPQIHSKLPSFTSIYPNFVRLFTNEPINGEISSNEEIIETIDSEKLENLLSFLQSTVEDSFDLAFEKMGLELTEDFVVRVLETPLLLPEKSINFFIWASKKNYYEPSLNSLFLLVNSVSSSEICTKNEAYLLWDLIKDISKKEKDLITVEILNKILSLFGKLEKSKASLEVFNMFDEIGLKPNAESYFLIINALSKKRMVDPAWLICERMISSGELPEADNLGKIILFLCKMKKAREAYLVYLSAKEKSKTVSGFYIDFLVGGLAREDESVLTALELLKDYSGEMRKYAIKPFNSVVKGLCRKKEFQEVKNLLNEMMNSGPPPGNSVFNLAISSLSKAGEMDDAVALLRSMESRGLKPDIYTYGVIMSGYSKGGIMEEARKVFNEAKERHTSLISTLYHIMIRGYCKIEEFGSALECLEEMKNDGIKPNADEYNKMVLSLCLKALDWRSAEKLLEEVKRSGLRLNPMIRGLVAAMKELEEEETKSLIST